MILLLGLAVLMSLPTRHAMPARDFDAVTSAPPARPALRRVETFAELLQPSTSGAEEIFRSQGRSEPTAEEKAGHRVDRVDSSVAAVVEGPKRRRGRAVLREDAARIRAAAIPVSLQKQYNDLPPLRTSEGRPNFTAHADFWTKAAAQRDPNFTPDEVRRARFFIRRELQDFSLKVPTERQRRPSKVEFLPHHLFDTIKQLAERKSADQRPLIPEGLRLKRGPHPSPTPSDLALARGPVGLTAEEVDMITTRNLHDALGRTGPEVHYTPADVEHARLYIRHQVQKRSHELRRNACLGKESWRRPMKEARAYESENIRQLADRRLRSSRRGVNEGLESQTGTSGSVQAQGYQDSTGP